MKILVPVDGSPASIRAVKLAIDQAKPIAGTSLVLVNVQNLATLGLAEDAGLMPAGWIEQEEERTAEESLQEAIATCREAGVTYMTRSERGIIASTIDRVAREEQATHIIMGTRGLGGVRGLLLGSVTTQLLHLVEVPVTLVK
jgi:nucleotide-binding universal stress UspA family protein